MAHLFNYEAFGLSLNSEFQLPELHIGKQFSSCDVEVKKGDLSEQWDSLEVHPFGSVVRENFVIFQLPDVAIFLIKNGNEIIVSPKMGADPSQIRLYILGTCMGAILLQRKILPLHGSAVAIDGKAYAFIGDSGAGKSTLASAFLARGYQLISDDVIPVSISLPDRNPYITPSYPQQKLWAESLNQFGMEEGDYSPIYDRENKYLIPVVDKFARELMPLAGVFELVTTSEKDIEISPVLGLERISTLFIHTYRHLFIKPLGLMDWHFSSSAKIVENVDIYQLKRPKDSFTANKLVSLILKTIQKEEVEC